MPEEEKKIETPLTEPKFDRELFLKGSDRTPESPVESVNPDEPIKPEGKSEDKYPDGTTATPKEPVKADITSPATPTSRELTSYWKSLKEDLGDKYQVPDTILKGKKEDGTDLTPKEEFEILRNEIYKFTDFGHDEFVEDYLSAKKTDGFDKTKWIEQKSKANSLNDDDFLFAVYKSNYGKNDQNLTGLDDEQITSEINKMSVIEKKKEVVTYRNAMQSYALEEKKRKTTFDNEEFDSQVIERQKINDNLVNNYLIKIKGKNNIDGIEFSEADLLDYQKTVPELLKIEVKVTKDGQRYAITKAQTILEKVMGDEQSSLTLLPVTYLIDKGKMKGYSSMLKEKVKKEILDKLDTNPEITPGTSSEGPYTFDRARFLSGK